MPTIGIVGVGLIGRAWSNVFSRAGWDVRLYDSHAQTLAAAPDRIAQSLQIWRRMVWSQMRMRRPSASRLRIAGGGRCRR